MKLLMMLLSPSVAFAAPATDKPNIIFILADDMGYGESDKKQSFFLIT